MIEWGGAGGGGFGKIGGESEVEKQVPSTKRSDMTYSNKMMKQFKIIGNDLFSRMTRILIVMTRYIHKAYAVLEIRNDLYN